MTEDQIKPLCTALLTAIKAENDDEIIRTSAELLAGFLTDINRIAWFLEQINVNITQR